MRAQRTPPPPSHLPLSQATPLAGKGPAKKKGPGFSDHNKSWLKPRAPAAAAPAEESESDEEGSEGGEDSEGDDDASDGSMPSDIDGEEGDEEDSGSDDPAAGERELMGRLAAAAALGTPFTPASP